MRVKEYAEEYADEEEGGYCPQCSGSGEGMYDGSRCSACNGSGEITSGPSREDYEAEKADYLNDLAKDDDLTR